MMIFLSISMFAAIVVSAFDYVSGKPEKAIYMLLLAMMIEIALATETLRLAN